MRGLKLVQIIFVLLLLPMGRAAGPANEGIETGEEFGRDGNG